MTEPQVKFNELINAMVEEQTLSSQSFKRLSELREEHEKTIEERKIFERNTEEAIKILKQEIDSKNKIINDLQAKEVKQKELDDRERKIESEERRLEVETAKFLVEVKHQTTRAETAIDLFKTVFANVTLRRGISQTVSKTDENYIPGKYRENGQWESDQTQRHTISESNTQEQTETET